MATLIKEITLDAPAEAVWDAVADVGAAHTRFAPGFVTDVHMVEGARLVTFDTGQVFKELIVGLDHERRRLAYSVESEALTHHNASFQVFEAGPGKSRLVWTVDLLPDTVAPYMEGRLEAGLAVAKDVVGRVPRAAVPA
ncbi:MAG: SRPBCC family protein [Proteobacteria bacterium]|nr:SRPBCC family protein [Pseudomonadota bacterium]